MTLNEYQTQAMVNCAFIPTCENIAYMSYGLVAEVGELMGEIAKHIRAGNLQIDENDLRTVGHFGMEDREKLISETGDILWFVAGVCHTLGMTLEEVAQGNLVKIDGRREKGTIMTHEDH